MITDKMAQALNDQIREELYSAYIYLSMSSYATSVGMAGVAHWFRIQTQEELTHTDKFCNYLNSQGSQVILQAIEQPPCTWESALEMFEAALAHEQHISQCIHDLSLLAEDEKDRATDIFLQWFISEQVEEEENAKEVIDQLKLAGSDGSGLFMIDRELAKRVFTPPATNA
ncbi:MAG: ferritin [Kiritimatiellae bacterium]|nr:ferritin [Kiritimatiellia bacterium]